MARTYAVDLERSPPLRLDRHALAPVSESWRQWVDSQSRPLAVDLFAGAGGLSLGLEQAGYRVILGVDTDPWALETHRHNFPGASVGLDLSEAENVETLIALLTGIDIDLVAGGPPCQPFSRAGRSKIRSLVRAGVRSEDDPRRELWQSFLAVVEAVRPAACLMENVPDMVLGDDFSTLRRMVSVLEALGYESHFTLLDAWKYGVPQHRQRFFLVALRGGRAFRWPRGGAQVTLKDAIGDMPPLGHTSGEREMRYRRTPRTSFQRAARSRMREPIVWDHITRPVRPDDREAFKILRPGGTYADLPDRLRRYRDDIFDDKYKKLSWNERSRSITAHIAKDGYWYIHPSEPRTLTVREAARVQTFPDQFRFAGSRSHAFAQIGNAVPPVLARAIGKAIMNSGAKRKLPARLQPSRQWAEVRSRLLSWAAEDRAQVPWRYPADPWTVLAGVVLGSRDSSGALTPEEFLRLMPTPGRVNRVRLGQALVLASTVSQRKAAQRLARMAGIMSSDPKLWSAEDWPRRLKVKPAEEQLLRALALREDRLIASVPSLRVVARVTGSKVHKVNEMSDGRLLLARVVGAGEDALISGAALHALGRTLCTATDPACNRCPLRSYCKAAKGART